MKAFSSWSGGKDCTLALHRFLKTEGNTVSYLLNMCENNSDLSLSHGISKELIKIQAHNLNIPLIQKPKGDSYEKSLKEAIEDFKSKGITAGIFGDIYLEEHRTWIERVCSEMKIEALFPLWGFKTDILLKEFIDEGFTALTVSVRNDILTPEWLGNILDIEFYQKALAKGIDPCAENGEYHTFVFNGPLFKIPVLFSKGVITKRDKHYFLELIH